MRSISFSSQKSTTTTTTMRKTFDVNLPRRSTSEEVATADWLAELPDVLSEFRHALVAMDDPDFLTHHSAKLSNWDQFVQNYGRASKAATATPESSGSPYDVDGFGTVETVSWTPPVGMRAAPLSPHSPNNPQSADSTSRILGLPTGKFGRVPTGQPPKTAAEEDPEKKPDPIVIFMAEGAAV